MTKILIVDDSEVEQKLAAGLISKDPNFELAFAPNGKAALSRVQQWRPDLVLTDLVMPEVDGLELVKAMHKYYPHIPVILMTAYGNENMAVEALEAGAASYVAKAQQSVRLLETVKGVLARSFVDRAQRELLHRLTDFHCAIRLENDPVLIGAAVDYIQQQYCGVELTDNVGRIHLGIALEEALNNALYHGNLELSAAEIEEARSRNGLQELVAKRKSEFPYKDRKLTVDVHFCRPGGARIVVLDEGPGFDYQVFKTKHFSERFEYGTLRGITLMTSFVDQVLFNDKGNEVTLVKRCEQSAVA